MKTIRKIASAIAFALALTTASTLALATPESDQPVWITVADLASDTGQVAATLKISSPWETDGNKAKVIYKIERYFRSTRPSTIVGLVIIDCKHNTSETLGSVRIRSQRQSRNILGFEWRVGADQARLTDIDGS